MVVAPGGEKNGQDGLPLVLLRLADRGGRGCWRRLVVVAGSRGLVLDGNDGRVSHVGSVPKRREQPLLDKEGGDDPPDGLGGVVARDADGGG